MSPDQAKLTPMLRHYMATKAEHPDALLLYRMGDFYELFFDDAKEAAPILEVQLTARQKGTPNEALMCGVPHHAVEGYIAKLVQAGRRVAVCDQVEDPAKAKGMVRREVTRIVTPGTVVELEQLAADQHNYLAALSWDGDSGAGAFLEVSTGQFRVHRWQDAVQAIEDLALIRPREVLIQKDSLPAAVVEFVESPATRSTDLDTALPQATRGAASALKRHFGVASLRGLGLSDREPATQAAAAVLAYAAVTQGAQATHVQRLRLKQESGSVVDSTTLRNLEVLRNLRDGGRDATLLAVLDRTKTAPGARKLGDWLREPLRSVAQVRSRHDAVSDLVRDSTRASEIQERLAAVGDLERLGSRAALGRMTPREADALRSSLQQVPVLQSLCASVDAELVQSIAQVDELADLTVDLEQTLAEDPPIQIAQGGVVATGVDPELDRFRSLAGSSKQHLMELQQREREATGISTLKVRFNRVFGYYLEVTRAQQDRVPEHYVRKQTLVNAERYITEELKILEEQILGAEERQIALEQELFEQLITRVGASAGELAVLADALSDLDVLASYAQVAQSRDYVRPVMLETGEPIEIKDGRHPVVEAVSTEPFVPNDSHLGSEQPRIVILTGPNMGGKSTYLRQVGLISIMAQAGCFVPAKSARLAVVDRVFTRVGASDDLARGESTFMVEMIETARILHQATGNSLVILDEVGRGTATFDGLSLAWAIVEFLHQVSGLKALFATHYHELTDLARTLDEATNQTMAVREWEDRVVFLRRVIAGSADKSYGLHVASLAGIPEQVVQRATQILEGLERSQLRPGVDGTSNSASGTTDDDAVESNVTGNGAEGAGSFPESQDVELQPPSQQRHPVADQLTLFTPPEEIVASVLRSLDAEALTPLAALNLIHSLQERLRGAGE